MFALYLKKVLIRFFFPMPLIGIILGVGAWLLLTAGDNPRRRSAGKWLLIAGLALYYLVGVAGWMALQPLVNWYAPLEPRQLEPEPYLLAVAGSSFLVDEGLPDDCRFNDGMIVRLHEAGRIARVLEERGIPYTLAVSVSNFEAPMELKERAVAAFFATYGIPKERLRVIDDALNSRDEVRAFLALPGRPVLISEAFHVPRLMLFAARNGVDNAIPAPVGVRSRHHPFTPLALIPSAENFDDARRFTYELLGIVEAKLF